MTDVQTLPRFSFSQLQAWQRCNFAWSLGYVEKWQPRKASDSMSLGSLIHLLLQGYYEDQLNEPGGHESFYEAQMKQRSQKLFLDSESNFTVENQAIALKLLVRYIRDWAPIADKGWRPVYVEKHVEKVYHSLKGRPFILEGVIDLVQQSIGSGKIRPMDHKSYKSRPVTDSQFQMDPQLAIYSLLLLDEGFDILDIVLNQLNTYQYKNWQNEPPEKLFTRARSYRSPVELENILWEIRGVVDTILDAKESETPVFSRNLRRDCTMCWFKDPCLIGLKGLGIESYLESAYVKKSPSPRSILIDDPV